MTKEIKLRVLIADDEDIARQTLRAQIETIGHQVIAEATDGEQAIQLAVDSQPDIALVDVRMPVKDGIDAAKGIAEKAKCPVVLLTGHSEEDVIERAVRVGVFGYLTKPVRLADLKPIVELCVARHRDLSDVERRLESRTLIQRAKGILMDEFGLTEDQAHKKIHFAARNHNRQMQEIAADVIESHQLPE